MFVGGLNNWKNVTLTARDGCDSDEVDLANTVILENITRIIAENIEVGSIGALKLKTTTLTATTSCNSPASRTPSRRLLF
jgi:hypothetical protein